MTEKLTAMPDEVKLLPWPLFGYAPGNYTSRCYACDRVFNDADKLAICCLECAAIQAKGLIASLEATRPTIVTDEVVEPVERPWQPWERNFSGGRIGVQEQQGENENWMILHVESGIGKTTTSLRLHEAWDLALMLSPQVKARLEELFAGRRKAENALHQFTWADTIAPLLRKMADDWDCDSSQCEFASSDMGSLSCPNMEGEGCRAVEADELRQFADALEVAATLRSDAAIAAMPAIVAHD